LRKLDQIGCLVSNFHNFATDTGMARTRLSPSGILRKALRLNLFSDGLRLSLARFPFLSGFLARPDMLAKSVSTTATTLPGTSTCRIVRSPQSEVRHADRVTGTIVLPDSIFSQDIEKGERDVLAGGARRCSGWPGFHALERRLLGIEEFLIQPAEKHRSGHRGVVSAI